MGTDNRLDSWKEIAAYLKRGVRTAQRWERDAALPIRRVGRDGQAVYAFQSELDAWWRDRSPTAVGPAPKLHGRDADLVADLPPLAAAEGHRQTRVRPFLSHAVGIDTESPSGHASMAVYFFTLTAMGMVRPSEGMAAARAAARRALVLDAGNGDAHAVEAIVAAHFDRDWRSAAHRFAALTAREPVSPLVRFHYASWFLAPLERHHDALAQVRRALADDPVYLIGRVQAAADLIGLGRVDEGIGELREVLRIDPRFGPALGHLGRELAVLGQVDEAMALAERTFAAIPGHPNAVGFLTGMLRRTGDDARASGLIAALRLTSPWAVARAEAESLVICERWDAALDAVAEAVEQRDPGVWIVLGGLSGKALRSRPRWPALRAELNLPSAPATAPAT